MQITDIMICDNYWISRSRRLRAWMFEGLYVIVLVYNNIHMYSKSQYTITFIS